MMTTKRRARELARQKYERQAQRRQTQASRRKRRQQILAAVVVAALVLGSVGYILIGVGSSSDAETPVDAQPTLPTEPPEGAQSWPEPPPIEVFAANPILTLATDRGDIVIETFPGLAPATVSSEVFLARQGFYDGTLCHRLTTQGLFVLQCGDPTGTGTGGPGYTVPDENLPTDGRYPAGTVAMANAGPGTTGSQFFIVYEDTELPPSYTIWGTVTSGLDIVRDIAASGVIDGSTDGTPAAPIFINSATVSLGPDN
jgi:peptidyl-prolyl cis-trans isomerase B (cyclophilin B)